MRAVRLLAKIFGAVLAFAGVFFALQGAGVIMWPADSFMLAASVWIAYGLVIAVVGALLFWWGSRRPRV